MSEYQQRTQEKDCYLWQNNLEQLERLRSEDTPCCLMITYTIDQFILDPKWNKDFEEFAKTLNFEKKTLHATHLLKLLDKMCKY